MSRNFRIYEKKRGQRRTGSNSLARAGEMLFFGMLFLAGCVGFAVILLCFILPEWRAVNEFVGTTCIVHAKDLVQTPGDDGVAYRPEVTIEYRVGDTTYHAKTFDICRTSFSDPRSPRAVLDRFEIGGRYACWYDPRDPETVVLVRGFTWWTSLLLIVPASLILIGGGGFLYRAWNWGKSAEHSAATAAGPIKLRAAETPSQRENAFPAIPAPTDMKNSPGTTLRFRLPISTSATFGLLVVLLAALLWNAVVAIFLYGLVADFVAGKPHWLQTIFLVPFALAGLFLAYYFFRRLLITTGVGPTLLEISDHPLRPGKEYEWFLSQSGRLRLHALELSLVGTEEVRYRQGTDTRTERRCIHRQTLFRQEHLDIRRGTPFEIRGQLQVPSGLMHSFKSENNALNWTLVVEGKIAGWPDYCRSFPIVIYPEATARLEP